MKKIDIYKGNKRKSRIFKISAPIIKWLFLILTFVFAGLSAKNSIGNMVEIVSKLDKDKYNREEISDNYIELSNKYGEWVVIGYDGSAFEVRFIDIKKAMFGGLMKTYLVLTVVSFGVSYIVGKKLFPSLAEYYKDANQDAANLAMLNTEEILLEERKEKKKKNEGGWF